MDVDADGVDAPTAACDGFGTAAAASDASAHVSASERRAVYARLAWLPSYRDAYALEAEQSSDLIAHLSDEFISAYARRKILSGSEDGQRLAEAHQARLRDSAGVLLRTQNVHHVPFSQAVKSIAFLASVTPKPIWLEARKKRQVVKREWAVQLLDEMLTCRPLPPSRICWWRWAAVHFDEDIGHGAEADGGRCHRREFFRRALFVFVPVSAANALALTTLSR